MSATGGWHGTCFPRSERRDDRRPFAHMTWTLLVSTLALLAALFKLAGAARISAAVVQVLAWMTLLIVMIVLFFADRSGAWTSAPRHARARAFAWRRARSRAFDDTRDAGRTRARTAA
jgi:uncharacterized membrane protein YtjA (UPF0391 family)